MKMKPSRYVLLLLALTLSVTQLSLAQKGDAKNAAPAKAATPKPGIHVSVMLVRNGVRQVVSPAFPFKTGDDVVLSVRSDFDAYVYILNRTLTGDPESLASRSMSLEVEEDRKNPPAACPYTMIFPEAHQEFKLKAGVTQMVPPRGHTMRMNDPAGVEELRIIASPTPDPRVLKGCVGKPAAPSADQTKTPPNAPPPAPKADATNTNDTDGDVLGQLNRRLMEIDANSEVAQRDFNVVTRPDRPDVFSQPKAPLPGSPAQGAKSTPPESRTAKAGDKPSTTPNPGSAPPTAPNPGVTVVPRDPSQPVVVEIALKHMAG